MSRLIITDSTSDLPDDFIRQNHIHIVPLNIHLEEREYKDGIDLRPAELYSRLRSEDIFPRTSQPSAGDFLEVLQSLQNDDECLVLVLSSELSGTYQSALLAQDMLQASGAEIHVIDSRSASIGLGFQVMAAQDGLNQGKDTADVLTELAQMRRTTRLFFAVDTLDYLARGGRIGQLGKTLGNLLQIKPVLHLSDGRVDLLEKVRTKPKAVQRILDVFAAEADRANRVAVLHVDALEEGQDLMAQVKELYSGPVLLIQPGTVIGSHTGPGTVGLCWY